ncbi:GNAT family N-acetyltransferase [Microvirga rosea]|nr:GNAT family N-acetyltransferase [Microvirga rosea]
MTLRPGELADIPFIMATERTEGYDGLVGRWDETQHRAELAKPGSAYLIGEQDGRPNGFAILQDLDDPFGNVLLKRVAVQQPGAGFGTRFLRLVLGVAFDRPNTYRVWLHVFGHNTRARSVYGTLGLREDGILREAYAKPDGTRVSLILMSILRPEWEASVLTPPPSGAPSPNAAASVR